MPASRTQSQAAAAPGRPTPAALLDTLRLMKELSRPGLTTEELDQLSQQLLLSLVAVNNEARRPGSPMSAAILQ